MSAFECIFDNTHYASSIPRKIARSAQLGPKYFLRDLPRYFRHRRSLGLGVWDWGAFVNPLRELGLRKSQRFDPPPFYADAIRSLSTIGVTFSQPPERLARLMECWWAVRHIPGDIIECGAYRGAASLLIALLCELNRTDKRVYVCDSFSGAPAPGAYDNSRSAGEFSVPVDQATIIARQAGVLGINGRIQVKKGLFTETLSSADMRPLKFSMAHIDCNLFSSTWTACCYVIKRMARGGIVVFDDYNGVCDLGARLAIDYYRSTAARPLDIYGLSGPAAYAVLQYGAAEEP